MYTCIMTAKLAQNYLFSSNNRTVCALRTVLLLTMVRDHVNIVWCHYTTGSRCVQRIATLRGVETQAGVWALCPGSGCGGAHCVSIFLLLSLVFRSPVLEPDLNNSHVQARLLGQLFSDVSRGLWAGVVRRPEDFQLLCCDCSPRSLLIAVCFTCNVCMECCNCIWIQQNTDTVNGIAYMFILWL